jgi:hypothetical protein
LKPEPEVLVTRFVPPPHHIIGLLYVTAIMVEGKKGFPIIILASPVILIHLWNICGYRNSKTKYNQSDMGRIFIHEIILCPFSLVHNVRVEEIETQPIREFIDRFQESGDDGMILLSFRSPFRLNQLSKVIGCLIFLTCLIPFSFIPIIGIIPIISIMVFTKPDGVSPSPDRKITLLPPGSEIPLQLWFDESTMTLLPYI